MRSPKTKKRSGKAEAERQALVRALAGKYAATNTNSEAFVRRKAEEIELEEHIRTHRNK